MVCASCTKIFDSSVKLPHKLLRGYFVHHTSVHDIEAAAEAGCYICGTLWERLTDKEKELVRRSADPAPTLSYRQRLLDFIQAARRRFGWAIFSLVLLPWTRQYLISRDETCYGWATNLDGGAVEFTFGSVTWKSIHFNILATSDVSPEFREHVNARLPQHKWVNELICKQPSDASMNSEHMWNLVEDWTSECASGNPRHIRCHENVHLATSGTVSRLVDVMSGDHGDQMRLTVSPQEREPRPYVTLSYHWGHDIDQSKLKLLRKSSLAAYQQEIPMAHFPRLFQDVITIIRKMNIRYLWIDAYCIIQGDELDWQVEASRMADVYQHALLNIAAGGAHNTDAPLMGSRDTKYVEPCQISVDWRNLANALGRAPEDICPVGSFYIADARYIEGQILDTPLNRRAWVMQEQQLSPRILHFGKHQLFWHCWGGVGGRGQACETFPTGTPSVSGFERAHQYFLQTAMTPEEREMWQINPLLQWHLLIMAYSRCDITKNTDRLIAISGLARAFAPILGLNDQDYAAGLWLPHLASSLCWSGDTSYHALSPPTRRLPEYVAPSWSWASVSGHIRLLDPLQHRYYTHMGMDKKEICSEFQIRIEPVTTVNPFGQLKNGQLSLSGFIVPGKKLLWMKVNRLGERGQQLNCVGCMTFPFLTQLHCNFDDIKDFDDRKRKWYGGYSKTTGIDLLPLNSRQHPTDHRQSVFEGIMVVGDVSSNSYHRVGYFCSNDMIYKAFPSNPLYLIELMEYHDSIVLT